MMSSLRKYAWISLISARSNLAYLSEVATKAVFLVVTLYIFLQLWQTTYFETDSERIGGLTLAQMLWYLTIGQSLILSSPRVTQEVDRDVRTGTLAIHLIRPFSYPLYRLWTTLGERTVRFFLNAVVGAIITQVFVGPIPVTLRGITIFTLSLPLAFLLDFLGNFLIGLGAFWLEDTTGILLIYSRITLILGGTLIPLNLFPDVLQPVLKVLPFSSIVYGPAYLFVSPDLTFLCNLIVRQGIAILLFSLCVLFVYYKAIRRINLNGG
jgi:ABC-2 type transport system permease protein